MVEKQCYFDLCKLYNVIDKQVDSLYLHHPKSRIDISKESRLKLTSQEVAEWRQDLGTLFIIFMSHLCPQKLLLCMILSIKSQFL